MFEIGVDGQFSQSRQLAESGVDGLDVVDGALHVDCEEVPVELCVGDEGEMVWCNGTGEGDQSLEILQAEGASAVEDFYRLDIAGEVKCQWRWLY